MTGEKKNSIEFISLWRQMGIFDALRICQGYLEKISASVHKDSYKSSTH